ncbi:MAG: glutamine amidotransferase [Hirschia sp.]|nr:glutamine amidotransferase [Hirschia sp.]MBF17842.1 glutamine amidotransferase [Hirschia sp.]|tara:strand:+ start:1094 stop:1810 length:717 start_codon:yes stop_codon:yes gene_type:complete
MKIMILETGLVPPPIRADFPDYPQMLRDLIQPVAPEFIFSRHDVMDGSFPALDEADGFLITGSPAGVYEDHVWMEGLFDFIRKSAQAKIPQVGICFGNQAIAHAFGGRVIKSPLGWGLGRHSYDIQQTPDWWTGDQTEFALVVSHKDQVVEPAAGSKIIARSDFAPYAALYYPDAPALSFQGHPEFNDDYAAALYNVRRGNPLSDEDVDAAIASLQRPQHNTRVASWIADFFRSASGN